jgi:hypothetical protein
LGQRTSGVRAGWAGVVNPEDATTDRLEGEAEAIRRHLDELLSELDRRRKSAVATTERVKEYAGPVLVGVVALGVCTGLVVRYVHRRRARSRLLRIRAQRWVLAQPWLKEISRSAALRRVRELV